jgi:hypothetical protein
MENQMKVKTLASKPVSHIYGTHAFIIDKQTNQPIQVFRTVSQACTYWKMEFKRDPNKVVQVKRTWDYLTELGLLKDKFVP